MSKNNKQIELCFRNKPSDLLEESKLHGVCSSLTSLVEDANKSLRRIAEEHGVTLGVEIYFELNPASRREPSDGSNKS